MKLLTKKLKKRFKEVGRQEDSKNPIVIAKFFNPAGRGTWYATEYDEETEIFFGYVSIFGDHNDEWGSFSLEQLKNVKLPLGLYIERDRGFEEKRFNELKINK